MTERKSTSGVLNIDKPVGLTSHDVVAHVRRLLSPLTYNLKPKVGHTGTLDPFATGVLLVTLGSATRLIQFTHAWDKEYEATFTLGATSDTDDVTGTISKYEYRNSKPFRISDFVLRIFGSTKVPAREYLNQILHTFRGNTTQLPPTYSAVKVKGKKLYEYARAGIEVGESKPRSVTIHDIKILDYSYPELKLSIRCSTGTYIRSLARDLGKTLGCGAYVSSLVRIKIGPFDKKSSIPLDKLSTGYQQYLHSPASLVTHLPSLTLTSHNIKDLQQGKRVEIEAHLHPGLPAGVSAKTGGVNTFAIFTPDHTLVGIANYNPTTTLLSPKINLC